MADQNQVQFECLLNALLSANDAERNAAEQALKGLDEPRNGDQLAVFLVNSIRNTNLPLESRQMACSLLGARVRPSSSDEDGPLASADKTTDGSASADKKDVNLYDKCTPSVQSFLKRELIAAFEAEKNTRIMTKMAEILADLSQLLSVGGRGGWTELLPFVFQLTNSSEPRQREGAMVLFGELGIQLGVKVFRPFFNVIEKILETGLKDTSSFDVRLAALAATAVFLTIMGDEDKPTIRKFGSLLPAMLECITVALQNNHEEEARSAIQNFIDVAEMQPSFFLPHLTTVSQTMFAIMNHESLSVDTRSIALEMLVSLCEFRPGSMKKLTGFVETIIDILLRWMTTCEDFKEWEEFEDPDSDSLSSMAEDALDRLSLALHGKTVVPALFGRINFLVSNADWRFRNAAMTAITVSTEGCKTALKGHVQETLMNVIAMTRDPNMRVRWSAINCVSQLCTDFGPKIQKDHGKVIVDTLCNGMKDPVPRVAAISAIAVVNFVTDASPEVVIQHSKQLYASLQTLFSSSVKVQENAITATTALLDVARPTFEPFYDAFVSHLKNILFNAKQKEFRLIRGKAMECLTFAGIAVGKQRFAADALAVLKEMLGTTLDADDPQISYLQSSFGTLSECLGEDFVQFLPTVLPPTLSLATQKAEVELVGRDAEREGWETIELEDQTVAIHTAALDDKASAIHILSVYASNLGAGFLPYVDQCLNIALSNLDFIFHEVVRGNAYMLLSYLMQNVATCVKGGTAPATKLVEMFTMIVNKAFATLSKETDGGVLVQGSEALENVIRSMSGVDIPVETYPVICKSCSSLLKSWAENQKLLDKERNSEDFDEESEESAQEADMLVALIMENLGDVIGACLSTSGERFAPYFLQEVFPGVVQRLDPSWGWHVIHKSLSILCDAVEYAPSIALQHGLAGFNVCQNYLRSEIPEMRQVVYYYVGVASVSMGAEQFVPKSGPIIAALRSAIVDTKALAQKDSESWGSVYDNAVASLLKIMHKYAGVAPIDMGELMTFLIQALPFTEDQIEARKCYTPFFAMVERFPTEAFGGPSFNNVPKLIAVVADMIENHMSEPGDSSAISAILKKTFSMLPQQVVSVLPQQQLATIQGFVSKY